MNRPRLFLSAVSEELRTARQAVAATVRTLGFDPVSQDDFPTGHGELRQWLREQLDSCEGLIQLVGDGYGAEPPEVDLEYDRVSYTQLEFLYARKRGKKTWVIVIGKDFGLDKPPVQLDLPRDNGHPDPTGYQAERRMLQQNYIAQLKRENHLRHTANNVTELQNIALRLRDELGELRQRTEGKERRLTTLVIAILLGLVILSGGGWWAYQSLHTGLQQAAVVNTEKIRAHLRQTTEETHRRELAEAEAATDWKQRQHLRDAAENAHRVRLSRIEELAVSFAEIEGKGTATSVFQEMTRILTEQSVDEAIAYVSTQRAAIFQTVRARTATVRDRNRADLQPLLRTAGLHQANGQAHEARTLYNDILAIEPDWPEAIHTAFWFLTDQGDLALVRTTLADAKRDFEEAHRMAQRLAAGDPSNTQWQRDLNVSYNKLGDEAVTQGKLPEAAQAYRDSLAIGKTLVAGDPGNTQWQRDLSLSYERLGDVALAQGKLDDAAQAYRDSLGIRNELAASDPRNREWQRELSLSYERLGYVARAQGQLAEAAEWFEKSRVNWQDLLKRDPTNVDWQRGITITIDGLGDVAVAQGQLIKAARLYNGGLAVRKTLASSDLSNTVWQRDLWISYYKLADLAEKQNNSPEASTYWKQAFDVLSGIDKRGLHLSPGDRQLLETLRRKVCASGQ